MGPEAQQRRLSAILAADVAGYTRLVEQDTAGTVAAWQAACTDIINPAISEHFGRIVKHTGDGFLAEFSTVQDAVNCAIAMQEGLSASPLDFRMGVNLGDVIDDGEDIHGEGVNIAARIEALADPGGINITGSVFDQIRNRLDHHFVDLGEHEVKHVSAPVKLYRVVLDDGPVEKVISQLALPEKPSMVVLPFDNMSADVEQEYFADGLTEDIITELSRFQTFFVIARHSAFAYKGKPVKVQDVGRGLGVHYVVEGSVRRAGNRLRVVVQLIEAASGNHIWAERYDHDLADVFDLQDEVTRSIVAAIPGRLAGADLDRISRKRPESMVAYDYVLRGKMHHHRSTKEDNAEALRLLDKAIELDPEFAEAYAWKSCTYGQAIARGFGDNKKELFAQDVAAAEKALSLDENNIECQWIMCELNLIYDELEQAEFHHQKAFALNPNDPRIVAQRGELLTWQGHPVEGADWLRQAMRLDPYDAAGRAHLLGRALYVARYYVDAIEAFKQVSVLRYGHHAEIAACYSQLGSGEKAELHAGEVLRLKPDFSIADHVQGLPFKESRDREHHRDGLRKAGLPE
jgi:adenylate cyclase